METTSRRSFAFFFAPCLLAGCGADPDGGQPMNGPSQPFATGGAVSTGGVPGAGGGIAGAGGTVGAGGTITGAGGSIGTGGAVVGAGGASVTGGGTYTAAGYLNLAPPVLTALDPNGATPLEPPPPAGWNWYAIEGTECRDGSPSGIFVRFGSVPKLLIYLEGGGACTTAGFCNFNPPNVNMAISGTGETVLGSAAGLAPARQQPGVYTLGVQQGIFDDANAANPYKGWSQVYVPYCTGDVHFGSNPSAMVPGVATPQRFVGYSNMQTIVGHLVPTFGDRIERLVITGASAGSFGAALNFSMVQDAFADVRADVIMDAGLPFTDEYMFPCMQKRWRELWGFDTSLPADCEECFAPDGGGLVRLADFLMGKHPHATLAAISATQDEVMRLFFSMGLGDCASIDTADPVSITVGQGLPGVFYPGIDYENAVYGMLDIYGPTNRLAAYGLAGTNVTLHQHTFRARFYEPATGGKTIAQFVSEFLDGNVQQVLP